MAEMESCVVISITDCTLECQEAQLTLNDVVHNVYMFSARTENGPVTPRIVNG